MKLKSIPYIIKPIAIKNYFIAKSSFILSYKLNEETITIQKNYRRFKGIQLKNKLLYCFKYKLNNQKSFLITKINIKGNELQEKNKIQLLQRNIKLFLNYKLNKDIQYQITKAIDGNYIEKIYINKIYMNLILFTQKIKKAIKLIIFNRIEETQIIKEYYINSLIKLQKSYKLHYKKMCSDSNKIMRINSNKNNYMGYVSIKRIKKNIKEILFIQKRIKHFIQKKSERNKIIINKPKTNNNNFVFNLYISKKYIVNEIPKLIQLQNQIRKYIYQKKAKEIYYNPKNIKFIIKSNINKEYIITKEKKKTKENIDRINKIQNYYKKRFKYLKNNILNIPSKMKNKSNIYSETHNNINFENNFKTKDYYKAENENIILRSFIKQNKKPVCLKGFYCDKKRIIKNYFEELFLITNKSNRGLCISKSRILNNNKEIEIIQSKFRRILKENRYGYNNPIIRKPLIPIYELVNYNKKNSTHKSKASNEIPIQNDFIGEKIYTVYNKSYLSHMCHINMNNYYYISKIRRINDQIDINSEREYESILNEIETRKNNTLLNNKINNEEEPNFLVSEIYSEINKNKEKYDKINSLPININSRNDENYEIDKDHLTFKESNSENENEIILKFINKNCYIEKIRFKNDNVIKNIKELKKKKIDEIDMNEKSDVKNILKNIKNKFLKSNSNQGDKNINNINNIKGLNLLSNTQRKSFEINTDINNINFKENSMFSRHSDIISNGNNIIYIKKEKISDKEKRKHQNININNKINYFKNKTNYTYFFRLLQLFLTKNIQEYIFYKIKRSIKPNKIHSNKKSNKTKDEIKFQYDERFEFDFPFYIKALHKCFNIYKNTNNERFKKFWKSTFPLINKDKSFYYNFIYLSTQNKKKLISTNLYDSLNEKNDLIQFMNNFTCFDKHISNKKLFMNIINDYTFYNTNIFTLIKFIDRNIDNKVIEKQKYNIKKNKNNFEITDDMHNYSSNGSDIEILDSEINDKNDIDYSRKNDINYFIYENK